MPTRKIRVIDEVRARLRKKVESMSTDPDVSEHDKYRFKLFYDFFRDVEAVAKAPKSTVVSIMIEVGFDFSDIEDNKLYLTLLEEVNAKYVLVDERYIIKDNVKYSV